jgi:predicted nucleotidyltransferase component of viral defense system
MDPTIEQMLLKYPTTNVFEKKNAIKEILQEIVLCGLSRAGFFREAAFYGGTALRIFHGLDRFSEDLDFSLREKNLHFDLSEYFPTLEKELRSYGFRFRAETKEKSRESDILSAFLKGGTREHVLRIDPEDATAMMIDRNELIKIKIEVDVNPPDGASFSTQYRLLPIPYEVTLYDLPSLFAGKLHAVLCRAWKSRVKGRDLYDYVFYRSASTPVNMEHLATRLKQSGYIGTDETLTIPQLKRMLCEKFATIDFDQAKRDVQPFIKNPSATDVWKPEFFYAITEDLRAQE